MLRVAVLFMLSLPWVAQGAALNYFEKYADTENLDNLPFDVPTEEDIDMGLLLNAPDWWGNRVRKDKSLRILLLGGTNTAKTDGYASYLSREVAKRASDGKISAKSYVINEGVLDGGPQASLHKKFAFEDKYPVKDWPNVVCLEYSVNLPASWNAASLVDRLTHYLDEIYIKNGLLKPSYLVIDLFAVGSFYSSDPHGFDPQVRTYPTEDSPYWKTPVGQDITHEVEKLNPPDNSKVPIEDSHGFSRGAPVSNYITPLARFYGYPMVSLSEALFPSFVLYYQNSIERQADHTNQKWPFMINGVELSRLGSVFLVQKLIMPFLDAELARPSSAEPNRDSIYDFGIFMFEPENYVTPGVLASFTSWGKEPSENTLKPIVVNSAGWDFIPVKGLDEGDISHTCYGSVTPSNADTTARFNIFFDPHFCSEESSCGLEVTYVHAEDAKYVGDARCNLYPYGDGKGKDIKSVQTNAPLLPDGGYHIKGARARDPAVEGKSWKE